MAIPHPNPASTVILVRKGPRRAAPSVLLLQRKSDASWLGGAWVFPGGRVDDGDRDLQWRELADGASGGPGGNPLPGTGKELPLELAGTRTSPDTTSSLNAQDQANDAATTPPAASV